MSRSLQFEMANFASRVDVGLDDLLQRVLEALRRCRKHKNEKRRAEAAADVDIVNVLLPPWFFSGSPGGSIADPGDSDGSTSLGGSGGLNDQEDGG